MRQQKGCVSISRTNWVCRWRESVPDGNGGTVRKLRFKILGPITADHRRNKDRSTGKLRIPDDIQAEADKITGAANSCKVSVLTTIGEFVSGTFLPEKERALKPSSYVHVKHIWTRYLKDRIAKCCMRDFERKDAAQLWRDLNRAFPHLRSQTFRHIRFAVRGIFESAKDLGLFYGENPAEASLPANLPGKSETKAYTVDEVLQMLKLFTADPEAQALIALAFGSGLRKGEMAGLDWKDLAPTDSGAIIRVRRSVWCGQVLTPKTESSADTTAIDSEICEYLEAWRELCGKPTEGPIFPGSPHQKTGREMPVNLDSFERWRIKPLLNRCGESVPDGSGGTKVCCKSKAAHGATTGHEYKHDATLPEWVGWHALRRGAATFAASKMSGNGTAAASLLLRHSHVSTTEAHYIKATGQEKRVRAAQKVINIQQQRQQAASAIGAGLKAATSVN